MDLWVATSNQGKLNEFKSLLLPLGIKIHSPAELPVYSSPVESGDTFEANARIKAKAMKSIKPGVWIVAEDSGLEVSGINNMPGVHSARYAGDKASDAENTAKLLKMLHIRNPKQREAQFRCTIIAYSPEGEEFVFHGSMKGSIATNTRGSLGFGYDNVFIPEDQDKTLAELGSAFKNKVSHRAQAIRQLAEVFKNLGSAN